MAGTLYLCATPIGNLEDITLRVLKLMERVDVIAAEDTRNTLKLLNHFEIKTPMTSYHEHNKVTKGPVLVERLLAGESIALVTDAGMPGISDPGADLVKLCYAAGVPVTVAPGASAAVVALVLSGLDTRRFVFEGFLPVPKRDRRERLAFLQNETRTMIFYEAPHKLRGTLDDLAAAFGADRSVSLCRELTKLHEEIKKTTLGEAVAFYKDNDPRGEYVLVMAGAPAGEDADAGLTLEQAAQRALELTGEGFGPTAAAKAAAQGTPYSKSEVYKQLLVLQQDRQTAE